MAVVGYATIQLIPSLKGFASNTNGQMRPVVNSIGTDAGKKAGGLFGGSFVQSVGKIMAAAGIYEIGSRVASGISGAITTGIKGFADLQTYTISFKTLLGSASKANDMIRDLYKFAAVTPFDVEGSVVGAQKLLGVGVAAKDIIPTLTTLGDSTAALGGSTADFNSVLLAYSQIMARGKVSTQDLYQISNTGIPIFQLLSKALGKPVGEIQKLIETGNLASSDVLPKLLAQMNKDYGGAMTGQAETLIGLWSTFKDTMSQVLTQALTPVGEWLSTILPGATTAATNTIQNLSKFLGQLGTALANSKLGDSKIYQGFVDAFADTDWAGIGNTVVEAFTEIANGIAPVVKSLGDFVGTVLPPLSDLLTTLGANATDTGETMSNAGGKMGEASQAAGDASGEGSGLAQFNGGIQGINDQMNGLYAVLGFFSDYIAPLISGMTEVVNAFAQGESAAGIMSDAIDGKFGLAMQLGAAAIFSFQGTVVRATTQMLGAFLSFITGTVGRLGAWAGSVVVTVTRAMVGGVAAIGAGVAQWIAALVSGLAGFVTSITVKMAGGVSAVAAGMSQIYSTISGWAGSFFSAGASLISGFVRGIVSQIGAAATAASQVVSAVANFFPHSPAPEGPFSGRGWTLYSGRSLVDGFSKGIQQRQGGLRALMSDTFGSPVSGPSVSVAGEVAAATTSRAGTYIGQANVTTTGGTTGVIDELNFLLRNLNRGGR